jgi:DNA-binding CsgD family transcriptional regulator/tetratricopeptide (TPR) repeat protein
VAVGVLTQLGHHALNVDDLDAAREWYTTALARRDSLGDSGEVAVALAALAYVDQIQGRFDAARPRYEDGLAIVERLGDESLRAYLLGRLGDLSVAQGRFEEARRLFEVCLGIYRRLGARARLAGVLESFARLAAAQEQSARALRLAGAAAALRDGVAAHPTPGDSVWLRRGLDPVRARLGELDSAAAWAQGRALSLEQAVGEALTEDDRCHIQEIPNGAVPSTALPALAPPTPGPASLPAPAHLDRPVDARPLRADPKVDVDPLTPREREVSLLVARGLTNRAIGDTLVITEGTANLHVKHILGKLGFASRAQIAAWVVQRQHASHPPTPGAP